MEYSIQVTYHNDEEAAQKAMRTLAEMIQNGELVVTTKDAKETEKSA